MRPPSPRSVLRVCAAATPLFFLCLAGTSAAGCGGKGGDSTTGPSQSVCSRVSMSSNGGISFQFTSCPSSTYSSSITGIQYDNFGRRISYGFDVTCVGSNERYTGNVTSISYNEIGQVTGWVAVVNGQTCRG